jgi:hypothetical protein
MTRRVYQFETGPVRNKGANTMPRENDLEGVQDQGGKHGGQKDMPKPEPKPPPGSNEDVPSNRKQQPQRDKA